MVVPTLAHRGAALDPLRGGGSASAAGLVPIGRDSPIGRIRHFMGSPSPFGQPTRSSRDLPDDEARSLPRSLLLAIRPPHWPTPRPTSQALALTGPADAMHCPFLRLAHLRVIGSLWAAGGPSGAPSATLYAARPSAEPPSPPPPRQALDLDELPVLVDVLNASRRRCAAAATSAPAGTPCLRVALTPSQCPARRRLRCVPHARVCHRAHLHPLPRSPHRTACPRSAGSSTHAMKTTSSAGSPPQPRCSSRSRPCSEKRSRLRAPTVLTAAALGSSAEALQWISRRRSGRSLRRGTRRLARAPAEVGGAGGGKRAVGAAGGASGEDPRSLDRRLMCT